MPQLAALFCEQTDLPDMRTLKSQAESHALAVGQGFRVTTWESGMHSLSKHCAIRLLDTKEMNWYTASPTTGAGIFKKRATAFISIFPVLSAGLRGITNPTSLMRLLGEVAEAFEIESTIPHVMAERVGRAMATPASSVSRRKEDEHGEEWANRICQHKTDLRISGKSLESRRFDDDGYSSKSSGGARAKEYATVWASDRYERVAALLVQHRNNGASPRAVS